ncbi:MAG: PilN domain-containing protein [Pseudomonadota bacterium]
MKQTVNLLRDELKPIVHTLTLTRLITAAIVLLVIAVSVSTYVGWQSDKVKQQLERAKQQVSQAQQKQQQQQQQLEQREPSQQLVEQTEQLNKEITAQRQLNTKLAQQQQRQTNTPDQLMEELSDTNLEGLWLTEFSMTSEGVSLTGRAIKANLLPRWMKRFEQTELLSRSRFAVVDLDRNDKGEQIFSLTNQDTSEMASESSEREDSQ